MTTIKKTKTVLLAKAKSMNIPVSTKHCIEISRCLRYKNTSRAKKLLEDVIGLKKPVPFKKFNKDMGHKKGMAAGRFPQKAATEFLKLVKSVEANAQSKGLNAADLKIVKVLANKASIPMTGGRHRYGTKRTHLEIEVKERGKKKTKVPAKEVQAEKKEIKKEEMLDNFLLIEKSLEKTEEAPKRKEEKEQ